MSDIAQQFREPQPRPPEKRNRRNRLTTIARRARYLTGAWLGRDPGSMVRDLDNGEIAECKHLGTAIGAAWVANARGIAA